MSSSQSSPYHLDNVRAAIGHYLLGRGAGAVIGLATVILLARYMDVPTYAGYTALMGLAGIAAMLASLGLERAVTRFVPEGRLFQSANALRVFVWKIVAVRLISTGLVTALIGAGWQWIVSLFDFVTFSNIPWPLVIFLLANSLFSILSTVLQALVLQKLLTRITVLLWGGRLVSILILTHLHGDLTLELALWLMAIPELVGVTILILAVSSAFKSGNSASVGGTTTVTVLWPKRKDTLVLAGHSYAFNVLASLPQGYFMRTLIAATLPAETVAAYGFFSSLIDRLRSYLPLQLMYNLAEPVLIARYIQTEDVSQLRCNTQLIYKINLLLLVAIALFFFFSGPEAIPLLTSGKFADMSWILVLLLVQAMLGTHVMTMQLFFNARKLNQILSLSSLAALIGMLAYLAVVFMFGASASHMVLFAPLAYEIVMNATSLLLAYRYDAEYFPPLTDAGRLLVSAMLVVTAVEATMAGIDMRTSGVAILAGVFAGISCIGLALIFRYAGRSDLAVLSKLLGTASGQANRTNGRP